MARRKLLVWLTLSLLFNFAYAQSDSCRLRDFGRNISPSNIYESDIIGSISAASAFLPFSEIRCTFSNRFLLKEFMTESVSARFRVGQNAFMLGCEHVGYSRFGELTCSAAYARSFGKHLAFALNFHYFLSHAAEYQNVHSISFDISCHTHIAHKFGLGFAVHNPARLKFGITGTLPLPTRFIFVFDYQIGKNLLIFTELEDGLKTSFQCAIGTIYKVKCLFLTLRIEFPTPEFEMKVQLSYRHLLVGINCQYLLPAGLAPQAAISYLF